MQAGMYRHFKGGLYEVLMVGRHTETGEDHVIYKKVGLGEVHIRPLAMFMENVDFAGRAVPRFERVEE